MSDLAIEATGLVKSYGKVSVLAGVDLLVPRGSVFALLGQNGAGKTTTVRIMSTLTEADAGTAKVAGFDVRRERRRVRRAISLTGQYAALDGPQTGVENLRMIGRLCGLSSREAKARSGELLAAFGLTGAGGRRVATYSGGMRRRLDLAASLMGRPEVIFLDEPTTGLDLPSRQELWQVISELANSGAAIFLTTQYLEEADRLADKIAVIRGGQVVAEGTAAQLKQKVAGQRLAIRMASEAAFSAAVALLGGRAIQADRPTLTIDVATTGDAADVRAVLDYLDPSRELVSSFTVRGATLDDVFMNLVKETTNV